MLDKRQIVLEIVKKQGPLLPVKVAKEINVNIIFASAILSELCSQKQVFITNTKIGGSPLYYVDGQEKKLEFLGEQALKGREKEAFNILKDKKLIRDKDAIPWLRFALRQIKDFSVPVRVNISGGEEIFWKWYLTTIEEANTIFNSMFKPKGDSKKEIPKENKQEKKIEKEEVKKSETADSFENLLFDYFKTKGIEVLEKKIIRKNTAFEFLVEVPSNVEKLKFFADARNKKKINEGDLSLAYHKGQSKKLPVLFLSTGELNKKAKDYLGKNLKGYLIFKQIN